MPTETQARALMLENMEHNPEFVDGYWFPDAREYRLVYVDPTVLPSDPEGGVATFRMVRDENGVEVPMSVGLVRPDEVGKVRLPKWWEQDWDVATKVAPPRRAA